MESCWINISISKHVGAIPVSLLWFFTQCGKLSHAVQGLTHVVLRICVAEGYDATNNVARYLRGKETCEMHVGIYTCSLTKCCGHVFFVLGAIVFCEGQGMFSE